MFKVRTRRPEPGRPIGADGAWSTPGTPAGMTQGPAQVATTFDGVHSVMIGAVWSVGLWRYVEP